jgi:hypothetical protein
MLARALLRGVQDCKAKVSNLQVLTKTPTERKIPMSLSKVIPLGEKASITLGQDAGIAKLEIAAAASAGGGNLKDFAEVGVSAFAKVHEDVLVDAGFQLIEAKFSSQPMVIAALEGLKAEIKALEQK